MMESFVRDFISSKYYQKLFDFDDVIMIYICGSRTLGCVDDRSDYDIMVVTEHKSSYFQTEFLLYKGIKVHWYFQCINAFFGNQNLTMANCIGLTGINYLNDNLVIYKNSKYENIIEDLLSKKESVSYLGDILGYQHRKELIDSIVSDGFISDRNKTKHLYMLCAMYYDITKQNLDIEFLTKIKRIRWQEIDEKYLQQCVDILGKFKDYMQNIDIDEEVKKIKEKLVIK